MNCVAQERPCLSPPCANNSREDAPQTRSLGSLDERSDSPCHQAGATAHRATAQGTSARARTHSGTGSRSHRGPSKAHDQDGAGFRELHHCDPGSRSSGLQGSPTRPVPRGRNGDLIQRDTLRNPGEPQTEDLARSPAASNQAPVSSKLDKAGSSNPPHLERDAPVSSKLDKPGGSNPLHLRRPYRFL